MVKTKIGILALVVVLATTLLPAAVTALEAPAWKEMVFVESLGRVVMSWNPVPGAVSYKILRSNNADRHFREIDAVSETAYIDTDIDVRNTYYYRIEAQSGSDLSPRSEARSVRVPSSFRPSAMPNVKIKWVTVRSRGRLQR